MSLKADRRAPKLVLKDVSVHFPGQQAGETVEALANLNLAIDEGEMVVALGASGCGKTTLLNLIAGFLKPSSGSIFLDNHAIVKPGHDRGVVFQKHALMPWLTVLENACFGMKLQGVAKAKRQARAMELLTMVGLEAFASSHIWHLSGGMQQRLGIARVLAADPEMMLMDEPFGALDAFTREAMQELLLQVWSRSRKTVFFITHSVDEALFLATDLLVLSPRPGRVVHRERPAFCREFLDGVSSRTLRSRTDYIHARERIHAMVLEGAQPS